MKIRAFVMARKGVLVTDESVRRMSRAQWLFEYNAILERESLESEYFVKSIQSILINVLGLNSKLSADNDGLTPEERFNRDLAQFTPLIFLAGNHHLLKQYFKDTEESGDLTGMSSVPDDQYEAMSSAIMDDMEPIDIPIAKMSVQDIDNMMTHKALGVKDAKGQFPPPIGSIIIQDSEDK